MMTIAASDGLKLFIPQVYDIVCAFTDVQTGTLVNSGFCKFLRSKT